MNSVNVAAEGKYVVQIYYTGEVAMTQQKGVYGRYKEVEMIIM